MRKNVPQIENAASAEKGKLLLEIKVNPIGVHNSRRWRMMNKLVALCGIFAAFGVYPFFEDLKNEFSYEVPEWCVIVGFIFIVVSVAIGVFFTFLDRMAVEFREEGIYIKHPKIEEFLPWADFKGYKKDGGECILLQESSKGIWKELGSENFYFTDKKGKIESIVGRYLQRMK
jgi:hypothetical protein